MPDAAPPASSCRRRPAGWRWRRTLHTGVLVGTLIGAPLLANCGSGTEPVGQPGAILVEPSAQVLEVGNAIELKVTVTGANGEPVTPDAVFWSSSNEDVARVDENGRVTAVSPGEARIAASVAGKSASSQITVRERRVAQVRVSPLAATVRVGQTHQYTARILDSDGETISGKSVAWSVEKTSVATVNSSGVVRGVAPGETIVRATSDGVTGEAQVTVTRISVARVDVDPKDVELEVDQTRQFTATPRDEDGNELTGRSVTWSSDNTAVATISSSGVVTARSPGVTIVRAVVENHEGNAIVRVKEPPPPPPVLTSLEVSPASATLRIGESRQFTVVARDANGNPMQAPPITWSVAPGSVATVSPSGVVTARGFGSATVTARAGGGIEGKASIVVTLFGGGGGGGDDDGGDGDGGDDGGDDGDGGSDGDDDDGGNDGGDDGDDGGPPGGDEFSSGNGKGKGKGRENGNGRGNGHGRGNPNNVIVVAANAPVMQPLPSLLDAPATPLLAEVIGITPNFLFRGRQPLTPEP